MSEQETAVIGAVIEECGRADYRERLDAELGEMADQEIWRAGKRLRELRP